MTQLRLELLNHLRDIVGPAPQAVNHFLKVFFGEANPWSPPPLVAHPLAA